MNQKQFIHQHEQQWFILEALLSPRLKKKIVQTDAKKKSKKAASLSPYEQQILALDPKLIEQADFPNLYREICQHLSLAQSRCYSPYLIERLSLLVEQAHRNFYQPAHAGAQKPIQAIFAFFFHIFPQTVRKQQAWLWFSCFIFYFPLIAMIVIIQIWPEFVYTVISPETVATMESMYDPQADHIGRERGSDSDTKMFGFYLFNNTSIGFRTFATGLLFGVGSIFTLAFNGLHIGAVAGHLTEIGYSQTFWSFVSGHSALELTAIVLSGAAGLKLGFSILIPGQKSRYQSLLDAAQSAVKIMAGAALMFLMAAFVEAFWSSSQTIPVLVKYSVGCLMWICVVCFFIFMGRQKNEP